MNEHEQLLAELDKEIASQLKQLVAELHLLLENMTAEQRLSLRSELFAAYCPECGRDDPGHTCQCWNDE